MSYSRWIDSKWYVYPADGFVSCNYSIDVWFEWRPGEAYEDFLCRVSSHPGLPAEDVKELEEILSGNMEEISRFMEEWKTRI